MCLDPPHHCSFLCPLQAQSIYWLPAIPLHQLLEPLNSLYVLCRWFHNYPRLYWDLQASFYKGWTFCYIWYSPRKQFCCSYHTSIMYICGNVRRANARFFCEKNDSAKSTPVYRKVLCNAANHKRRLQIGPTKEDDKTFAVHDDKKANLIDAFVQQREQKFQETPLVHKWVWIIMLHQCK